jgi:thiol-disulfide isomerase/thioredoxin
MGKASRTKQDSDRRARIAAQREAQRRAEQRKRIYLAGGSILVVAIVVVALVLVKLNSGGGTAASSSNGPTGTALTTLTKQVTNVPASVTDKVAGGGVNKALFVSAPNATAVSNASSQGSYFATVSGSPLTSGGKPEVLYLGAEYCPFCAAQRWAMVNALSRFGTFTGLTTSHSSSTDTDPNTPTFTFYKSTYKSDYINFTSVEENTNFREGNSSDTSVPYQTLQTPTADQQKIAQTYDPGGAIPFIDLGNKYVQVGNLSPLDPAMLAGKTWSQVAAAMNDPSSAIGKAVIGNANYMTAGICKLTNNQPSTACTPAIQQLEGDLAS